MIYLIDDNAHNQRLSYGASYVDEGAFDDILSHIEKVNGDFNIYDNLKNAEVILIHDTLQDYINGQFTEGSKEAREMIEDYAHDHCIPIVNFSDGHNGSGEFDLEGNILNLKKSLFYSRLYDFLNDYRISGVPQLNILAYGRNYHKVLLERNIKKLNVKLSAFPNEKRLAISDIIPENENGRDIEPDYLRNMIEMAQPALGKDYEDILNYIDDEQPTIGEFKSKIDNIFKSVSKYGKNTYNWK